jgi:hypothetical protein
MENPTQTQATRSTLGTKPIVPQGVPAILLYECKASNRDEIRNLLIAREVVTLECETLKQMKTNFKKHSEILDGVIYSYSEELKDSLEIHQICEFLKIPCCSVESYLRSPEDFENLVRQGVQAKFTA